MYNPRQIWHHVTPKAQLLIALSLATVLAFSAGLAAGIYRHATYLPTLTTDHNAVPAVAQPPEAAPAVQQRPAVAVPPRAPILPVSGTGTAYDWDHYGSPTAARRSANAPLIGTGSAYDGRHYGSVVSAPQTSPNVPSIGTGSVYDGGHYRAVETQPLDPAQQSVMDYLRAHSR
jgi:hypothetical protein